MKINYLIIGGGIAAGAAAIKIREIDKVNSIMILSSEPHFPYHRPPLTKDLWTNKKTAEGIFLKDRNFYQKNDILISIENPAVSVDTKNKEVKTKSGEVISYQRLLIATGGSPKKLSLPGSDIPEICYYRYLNDYINIRSLCDQNKKAVVIGGSFIGSEISASLSSIGVSTTMIFPGPYICHHLLPSDLGGSMMRTYKERGVRVDNEDAPVAFVKKNGKTSVLTKKGFSFEADILIAGIGIVPNSSISANAGLHVTNGIIVDQYLCTSDPDIFAAGDVALFPFNALNRHLRVEHWDNAINQGYYAGNNMVSAEKQPYTYIPYFFSDFFEFGYEAVGDVNSELEIFSDWNEPFTSGVLYYLSENYVKGILLWNIWNKKEDAKKLIGQKVTHADLKHAL